MDDWELFGEWVVAGRLGGEPVMHEECVLVNAVFCSLSAAAAEGPFECRTFVQLGRLGWSACITDQSVWVGW